MSRAQEVVTVQDQAEFASEEALNTVHEVFGHPDDDDETHLVVEWKNGGAAKLRRKLREGDFGDVPDLGTEDENNVR